MSVDKSAFYHSIALQAEGLMSGEEDMIANMANLSALLWMQLPDINWAGFYIYKQDQLVLGPFQGKPACVRIPMGKGVCGTAAATLTAQRIDDVHSFEGHIACDAASNSERVIPVTRNGELVAVLDIDSPRLARFDGEDQQGLCAVVALLEKTL